MKGMTWYGAVLLLAVTPLAATAQAATGMRVGARWADLDAAQETDGVRGLVVGAYLGIAVSERLALQIEANYGERGAEGVPLADGVLDPAAAPVRIAANYLDVPVLLRAGFPRDRIMPSFFVGPYAGFLMGCDVVTDDGRRSCDAEDAPARFEPRSTDFGVVAGGALDVAIGTSTMFVDLRFTMGLLSLATGENAMDANHTGLELSAGFAFPLGR